MANSKKRQFLFHSHGGATYTQKQRIRGAAVRLDSPQRATSDSAEQ